MCLKYYVCKYSISCFTPIYFIKHDNASIKYIVKPPTLSIVLGFESLISGLDSLVLGLESLVLGLESLVLSLESLVSGLESLVLGLESLVSGLQILVSGVVYLPPLSLNRAPPRGANDDLKYPCLNYYVYSTLCICTCIP